MFSCSSIETFNYFVAILFLRFNKIFFYLILSCKYEKIYIWGARNRSSRKALSQPRSEIWALAQRPLRFHVSLRSHNTTLQSFQKTKRHNSKPNILYKFLNNLRFYINITKLSNASIYATINKKIFIIQKILLSRHH